MCCAVCFVVSGAKNDEEEEEEKERDRPVRLLLAWTQFETQGGGCQEEKKRSKKRLTET